MKCAFIVPYFGKLPVFFQLFLNSCSANKHFIWYIFTDDTTNFDYPNNVMVEYISFEKTKTRFKQVLGEKIILERPYKLCDYRPTYGLVYRDLLKEYDYWGHCDIDLLFGNLEKYVIPLMQKGYDKIFAAGHLTLYKNTIENNCIFRMPLNGELVFEKYSQSKNNHGFDENGGNKKNIHNIFIEHKCKVYAHDLSFNCSDKYYSFYRSVYDTCTGEWIIQKKKKAAYFWSDGSIKELVLEHGLISQYEYIYMHFQGRKSLKIFFRNEGNAISIQPYGFITGVCLPKSVDTCKEFIPKYGGIQEIRMAIFRLRLKLGKLKIVILKKESRYDT